ncbi:MAG: hypothetical protein IJB52_15120, partial [Clostridia bacterium]|nr:hypothetical protein [Clostridia bacterium]
CFYGLFRVTVAVVFALAGFGIFRRMSAFFVTQGFLQFGFADVVLLGGIKTLSLRLLCSVI